MTTEKPLMEHFLPAATDRTLDVSVQYAEALLAGEKSVLVTGQDGQPLRYVFGEEYNFNR